jgi:NOL1/NOP2/fmu family ribosome biogenesis protein
MDQLKGNMNKERPVLITTEYKGVFFGYASETSGDTIKLRAARNCIYWPTSNKGFMGLASDGPMDGARVGPRADIELRKVTSVVEVTPEAAKRWEEIKWSA